MLIHPARERVVHQSSVQWASAAKNEWNSGLAAPVTDPDRADIIADFQVAYDEIAKTEKTLPDFETIVEKLPRALRNTTIIEFNTRGSPKTPEINWRNAEGWILVGGQAVDRGFTVDSLSVTYMPRGIGVGNADTLQQRARFFGYKRHYLGLCRLLLEQDLRDAFVEYVEHEQIMRNELKRIAEKGESLRSWRRRFVLDPSLNPCRQSVVSDSYARARPGGGWTQQRGALMTPEARDANSALLSKLKDSFQFSFDTTYLSNADAQRHEVTQNVPLKAIVDMLLDYHLEDPRDTEAFTGLLVTLAEGIRLNPAAEAAIYIMRPNAVGTQRKISSEGALDDGFQQGRTALANGGTAYPGDAFFKSSDCLSVQIHRYDLRLDEKTVAKSAPLLAINIPSALAKAWLVQIQSGQKNP
jgi:hypothetical protein